MSTSPPEGDPAKRRQIEMPPYTFFEHELQQGTIAELATQIVDAKKSMKLAVAVLDRSSNPLGKPLDGSFVEAVMHPQMEKTNVAEGIARALDALAPLRDGFSWLDWAERTAEEELAQPDAAPTTLED